MLRSKFVLLIVALLFAMTRVTHANTSVSFHSATTMTPEITLLESDNSHVTYRVTVSGMLLSDVEGGYQMPFIGGTAKDEMIGAPSLPRVPIQIGIPSGSTITMTTTSVRKLYFSGYNIAPIPLVERIYEGDSIKRIETYTPNDSIYLTNDYYPEQFGLGYVEGAFNTQGVARGDVYPIRFNPVTKQLEVSDTLLVTVSFTGGSGPAVQDLGTMNAVTSGVLINDNLPVTPPSRSLDEGTVDWISATNTSAVCDYLIVTPSHHWMDLHPGFEAQVVRFAQMRADLSGFDVRIVPAQTVTVPPTSPGGDEILQGASDPSGRYAWQGIHQFIINLHANGSAAHTDDHLLGYVLLIGDARDEISNPNPTVDQWLIPSPRPDWVAGASGGVSCPNDGERGSDHYYACLTSDDPRHPFDDIEDICVGRFPVGSTQELTIMVDKIHEYSEVREDRAWQRNILNMGGYPQSSMHGADLYVTRAYFGLTSRREVAATDWRTMLPYHVTYVHAYPLDMEDYAYDPNDPELHCPWHNVEPLYTVEHEFHNNSGGIEYVNDRLSDGAWLTSYCGHGWENNGFYGDMLMPRTVFGDETTSGYPAHVSNLHKLTFVIEVSCASAEIDAVQGASPCEFRVQDPHMGYDAAAEFATVKTHNGAVGWVGCARESDGGAESVINAMTTCLIDMGIGTVAYGYLRGKLAPQDDLGHDRRVTHYMGDPALDLLYQPNNNISANTTWTGTHTVDRYTRVAASATLTIAPGAEVIISNSATLDVWGRLVAGGGATVNIHGTAGPRQGCLRFNSSPPEFQDPNHLTNCDIHDLDIGLRVIQSNVQLQNVNIYNTNTAIQQEEGSSVTISGSCQSEDITLGPSGVGSSTLTISPGTTLQIAEGKGIWVPSGDHLVISGTEANPVALQGEGTGFYKLDVYGTGNLSYCNFDNAWMAVFAEYGSNASLTHCAFTNCGIPAFANFGATLGLDQCSISGCSNGIWNEGHLTMTGGSISKTPLPAITTIGGSALVDGADVHDNTSTEPESYYQAGVSNYYSALTLHCAELKNNSGPGLTCFGGYTHMEKQNDDRSGKNLIRDNMQDATIPPTQIYFANAQFDLHCGRNKICPNEGEPAIIDATPTFHDVTYNNWCGATAPYPPQYRSGPDDPDGSDDRCGLPPYTSCPYEPSPAVAFQQAWEQENTMLWDSAVQTYKDVITDYPGSPEAKLCPDRITFCESLGSKGWSTQRDYFLQMAVDSAKDEALRFECKASAAWCLVEMKEIAQAQEEFLALLDSSDTYYEYEKASLMELMSELENQPMQEMSAPGGAHPDRVQSVLRRMKAIMDNPPDLKRHDAPLPTKYALYQNYPNPFNPVTEIRFDLPEATRVQVKIFNTLGQLVTTLVDEPRAAGSYRVSWNGSRYASGMYVYQLKAGKFTDTKKMLLLK